jgi:hypothetical protein
VCESGKDKGIPKGCGGKMRLVVSELRMTMKSTSRSAPPGLASLSKRAG